MAPSDSTRFKYSRTTSTPSTSSEGLDEDTKIALVSGLVAGIAGLILSIYVIRTLLKRRRLRDHGSARSLSVSRRPSKPRRERAMAHDGTAHLLTSDQHPSNSQAHTYDSFNRTPSYDPQSWRDSGRYTRATVQTYHEEPLFPQHIPTLESRYPSLPQTLPLNIPSHRFVDDDASPMSPPDVLPERRSMHNSPKHLPRLVIPAAAAVPRSAAAVRSSSLPINEPKPSSSLPSREAIKSPISSASVYSQRSGGEYLDTHHSLPEEAPPPLPQMSEFTVIVRSHASDEGTAAALGRTDTLAIASLLQARAKRISGVSRAASDVSRIERWDSVKRGTSYSPTDDDRSSDQSASIGVAPSRRG